MGGPLHIVSANISGIRAAEKAGFFDWPHIAAADVLCLQETCADGVEAIGEKLGFLVAATDPIRETDERKPHGGVAIFSRKPLSNIVHGSGALARRGQFVACSIGSLRVASVYVTLDANAHQFNALNECFAEMLANSPHALIAGDFNIFRNHQDSWRFHEAVSRSEAGTDPTARAWLDGLLTQNWVDAMRIHHKKRPFYTWWCNEAYFKQNRGTRLDYVFLSPRLAEKVDPVSVAVYDEQRRGHHAQLALSLREQ
jgi:exodeoxyribonuclease III